MSSTARSEAAPFKVVVNAEEQYSIWRTDKPNALGWRDAGFQGSKEDCLGHIEKIWTDMRPLSLRSGSAGRGQA